jgi:hypothetical protein
MAKYNIKYNYELKNEIQQLEMRELLNLCLENRLSGTTIALVVALQSGDWKLEDNSRQRSLLSYFDHKTSLRNLQLCIKCLADLGWLEPMAYKEPEEKGEDQAIKTGIYGKSTEKK